MKKIPYSECINEHKKIYEPKTNSGMIHLLKKTKEIPGKSIKVLIDRWELDAWPIEGFYSQLEILLGMRPAVRILGIRQPRYNQATS